MSGQNIARRGALIVVEGIDRSGKSTQCDLLVKSLTNNGHTAKLMKFPERSTTIGKMINTYLKSDIELNDNAIHLLFSANRWELSQTMKSDLLSGTTLVIDRYAYSGVAYSAAKPGMSIQWCKQADVGLPKPDLVMFLNLTAEEAESRAGYGGERYEQSEFQKIVRENFEKLSKGWEFIDASGTKEDVHNKMKELAVKAIKVAEEKEIKKLWVDEFYYFPITLCY